MLPLIWSFTNTGKKKLFIAGFIFSIRPLTMCPSLWVFQGDLLCLAGLPLSQLRTIAQSGLDKHEFKSSTVIPNLKTKNFLLQQHRLTTLVVSRDKRMLHQHHSYFSTRRSLRAPHCCPSWECRASRLCKDIIFNFTPRLRHAFRFPNLAASLRIMRILHFRADWVLRSYLTILEAAGVRFHACFLWLITFFSDIRSSDFTAVF